MCTEGTVEIRELTTAELQQVSGGMLGSIVVGEIAFTGAVALGYWLSAPSSPDFPRWWE
jgi:lactobin A/cerein 7B family class IIb bacteriocin